MRIGEVAAAAGVSARALRYYEEQGLLRPERTAGGQRTYPQSAVDRVKIIQQLYGAGLSSRLIETVLPAVDARRMDPDLLRRLLAERDRIKEKTEELHEAGRRLDILIGLATQSDPYACPATLDRTMT
ncbi:MerR family transcriptional regulator [Streptomyces sp. AC512_CC834]|uniref:MerR family transcriptional regulator n=1 Tax=Streptomyces sp. AC512_CC834 TaxID=2823691 RepID=UPI001C26C0CF|nr:MerR family transcriptional regulator [Streptomyces sp. AC512_CC834]